MSPLHTLVGVDGISLRPTVVTTVIEDGAVLLDLDTKYFYCLNQSAWAIAQLFEVSSVSVDDIKAQCIRWGAPPDDVAIETLLAQFEAEQLVEVSTAETLQTGADFGPWCAPTMVRQAEPLQRLVTSAFDPSIPLAE